MTVPFVAQKALDYAASIARPRLVGSEGERQVAAELAEHLQSLGYHVSREPFAFWNASDVVLYSAIFLIALVAGLGGLQVLPYAVSVPAVLVILGAFPLLARVAEGIALIPETHKTSRIARLLRRFGLIYETSNIVGTLSDGEPGDDHPQLYLVAHYDSKSQPLPITVRAILFMALLVSSLLFVLLATLAVLFQIFVLPALAAAAVIVLAAVPLLFNGYGNDSPGAVDNASAVGVVLHAAELLAQKSGPDARLRCTILFTGAEERTLMGAAAFVRRHGPDLARAARLHFLNFDGVGVDGQFYYDNRGGKTKQDRLAATAREAAMSAGISLPPFRLFGALFDHIPFCRHGFDAVTLLALAGASRNVHTKRDDVDLLDVRGFQKAGDITMGVIERLSTGA